MKYSTLSIALIALGLSVFSCNKREIIPAPTPKVDLECHFYGKLNNTDLELTQNVNGFDGSSDADFTITASGIDSAVYYSSMSSNETLQAITIGHGSIEFDAASSSKPTLALFNNFFLTHLEPTISLSGKSGFMVRYKDPQGRTWESNENASYPTENVLYTVIEQESDASGDYTKFKVNFETYVYYYDVILDETDSILITDAVYTGWYQR